MSRLDQLVTRARAAHVADDDARAYVAELGRWARVPEPPPRRALPWWLGGGLAVAAAAAVILLVLRVRGDERIATAEPVRVGHRVALLAEAGTVYRVTATDLTRTEIAVEQGTVTARLFHGEGEHDLVLVGGGVRAHAVGTVYSLTVEERVGVVDVEEGTVRIDHDGTVETVISGQSWPPSSPRRARRNADALRALAPLPVDSPAVDADTAMVDARDASIDVTPDAIADAAIALAARDAAVLPSPTSDAASALSITERWRRARLLRGQGDFAAAIDECLAIADARDATWSAIALLEAGRIELGPRASPERAIVIAERFEREWSSHQLAPEARELRCRALRQLGRDAECAKAP